MGELTQAYLQHTGRARAKGLTADEIRAGFHQEFADVFCQLILFARQHNVDLPARSTRNGWHARSDPRRGTCGPTQCPAAVPAGTCALRGTADRRLALEAFLPDVCGDRRPRVLVSHRERCPGRHSRASVREVARAVPTGLLSADRSTSGDLGQVTAGRDRQVLVPAHRHRSEPAATGPIPPPLGPRPAMCVAEHSTPTDPLGGLASAMVRWRLRNPIRRPHRLRRRPPTYASRPSTAWSPRAPVHGPSPSPIPSSRRAAPSEGLPS